MTVSAPVRDQKIPLFAWAAQFAAVLLVAAAMLAAGPARADDAAKARGVAETLNAGLLHIMKNSTELGYSGRAEYMAEVVPATYDLRTLAARIAGVARFKSYTDEQRAEIVDAYERFSVASYARAFKGYSGESFTVGEVLEAPGGAFLVKTQLVRPGKEAVSLDYLVSIRDGRAGIADVYFNGVSETSRRRAEFAGVQAESGADGLVTTLNDKAAQLASEGSSS